MRIFGQNPRTDVDKISGDPRLSGHYACSLDGPNRVDGMYDVIVARHQTLRSHAHVCLVYIDQEKNSYSALCTSESDNSHCAQRPPTTSVSHAMTAYHQFDHRLIIGYGNSKISYEIIRVSLTFLCMFYMVYFGTSPSISLWLFGLSHLHLVHICDL